MQSPETRVSIVSLGINDDRKGVEFMDEYELSQEINRIKPYIA